MDDRRPTLALLPVTHRVPSLAMTADLKPGGEKKAESCVATVVPAMSMMGPSVSAAQ